MALFRGIQEYINLDANSITLVYDYSILLTSLAIYSLIPLKAIQYYIVIPITISMPYTFNILYDLSFIFYRKT